MLTIGATMGCAGHEDDDEMRFGRDRRISVALPANDSSLRKVFIWGQSNAIGQIKDYKRVYDVPQRIRCQDEFDGWPGHYDPAGAIYRDKTVATADVGALGSVNPKVGLSYKLAVDLKAAGKNPVIFGCCRSGTAIAAWQSGTGLAYLDATLDEAVAAWGTGGWHFIAVHGESDATNSTLASAYQTALTSHVAHVRSKLGAGTRVYVQAVSTNFTILGSRAAVRTAQSNFATGDGNAEVQLVDNTTNYPPDGSGPHFLQPAYDNMGALWAARILVAAP